MKKLILRVLTMLGLLLVLGIGALVVKFFVLSPRSRPAPLVTAPSTPEIIARGDYLVNHVTGCTGCHSPVQDDKPGDRPVEGKLGAGRDFGELPGFPGHLRAPNLTPDKETGIGRYTDGEVLRAMREGVGKDGHALFPQMPYLTYAKTLSDDDALAIVAYLRTLPAVSNDPGRMEVKFPVSMFIRAVPAPLTASPPPAPLPSNTLARGQWLLQVCSCGDCHDGVDSHRQKVAGQAMAGGQKFPLAAGKGSAIAANITSDKATGIGSYTDADLRRVLDEGKNKAGRSLYVMPWSYYAGLTKEDKDALVLAIRTIPAVANAVAPSQIE